MEYKLTTLSTHSEGRHVRKRRPWRYLEQNYSYEPTDEGASSALATLQMDLGEAQNINWEREDGKEENEKQTGETF